MIESYVSSLATANLQTKSNTPSSTRAIQQSKINAVIKGINESIESYKEDETKQSFGILNYSGPIGSVDGSVIQGRPASPIEIYGTVGNVGELWVGNLQPNGQFIRTTDKLSCCEHIEYYEEKWNSRSGWKSCQLWGSINGFPDPYFPSGYWNCYNRQCIDFVSCDSGAVLTNTGFCECRDVFYPVCAEVYYADYSYCYWDDHYQCYIWIENYRTTSCWRECNVGYSFTSYDSCKNFANACICVYQKYKLQK